MLLGHPASGASWEGYVIENLIATYNRHNPSYLRTSNGAELDFILERGSQTHVFECKLSKAPKASRGFHELMKQVKPDTAWIVAPVDEKYEIEKGVFVSPLQDIEI